MALDLDIDLDPVLDPIMNLDPDRDLAFDLKTFPDPALKRIRISVLNRWFLTLMGIGCVTF